MSAPASLSHPYRSSSAPRVWLPPCCRCKWFELWAANVREAVARGQMLMVFYFRGHLARHGAEWADSEQVRRVCIEPASVVAAADDREDHGGMHQPAAAAESVRT